MSSDQHSPLVDLTIRIDKRDAQGYPVTLTLNTVQSYSGYLDAEAIERWLPSRDARDDGAGLFNLLLGDETLRLGWNHLSGAHPRRRLRLQIDHHAPELHALPWECLHDPNTGLDLAADSATPFSRLIAGHWPVMEKVRQSPVRCVVAIANPSDLEKRWGLPAVEVNTELDILREALSGLLIQLEVVPQPCTLTALERSLQGNVPLLHVIAHGSFNAQTGDAALLLADEQNKTTPIRAAKVAQMVARRQMLHPLQLVFLAACHSARRSPADALRGLAPQLIAAGVPAVLAMQDLVAVRTARAFTRTFYADLLRHGIVDRAANAARAALLTSRLPGPAVPVFFLRSETGQLLDPPSAVEAAQRLQPSPLALLEQMPLDKIPSPAPPPVRSRMELSRNELFVGREMELRTLASALKGGETVAVGQTAAATGMGGIGKTQLAVEFAQRYGQFFAGGVFWIACSDPAAIGAEVAACAQELFDVAAELDQAEQVQRVQRAWREETPRLLIFDNCEDPDLLRQWRPVAGGCRVLITSRYGSWDKTLVGQTLALDTLPRVESMALLQKLMGEEKLAQSPEAERDLNAIAEELGDLPLALHMAGSFLGNYSLSPRGYLQSLQDVDLLRHRSLTRGDASPTEHEPHVARTFALSYDQLRSADAIDGLALALLARAAHFVPGEPIPQALLLATVLPDDADLDARLDAEDALRRLADLGLVNREAAGAVRLHRLLAHYVLNAAEETKAEAQTAVAEAVLAEANRLNNEGIPGPLLVWQGHLRYVTEAALATRDETAASLCNTLGFHLNMVGLYGEARPYYEQALAIYRAELGETHPNTMTVLNNLQMLLNSVAQSIGASPSARLPAEQVEAIVLNTIDILTIDTSQRDWWQKVVSRRLDAVEQPNGDGQPEAELFRAVLARLNGDWPSLPADHPYAEALARIDESIQTYNSRKNLPEQA